MPTSAIMVNEGRDVLISYLRNSSNASQNNKFYVKEFVLLTGITGEALIQKVWNESGTGEDLSQYMLTGELDGVAADARFDISDRTQEAGRRLRFQCVVPTLFDSLGSLIQGVAVLALNESNQTKLFGYITFEGQNKVSGSDLEIYAELQC
jgi:hypothetical protein